MSYSELDRLINKVIPYKLLSITTDYAMKYYSNDPEYILGVYIFYEYYNTEINVYLTFFAGDGKNSSICFANKTKDNIYSSIHEMLKNKVNRYNIYIACSKWHIDKCYLADKCERLDPEGILVLRKFSMTESIIWMKDGRAI